MSKRTGLEGLVRAVIVGWALCGGVVLLAVVAMQTASVVMGAFGAPLPGDFELTELGIAVAVFAFLPYCQMTDANVTADIFTSGLGSRALGILGLIASLLALVFAVVMVWRTWAGMENQFDYGYQTAILSIKIGYAFIPIIVSLVLLAIASVLSLIDNVRQTASPSKHVTT
ncbi:TRAP transporter small permease [Rhizobium halophytocola]|uniref:TRAP transporter small permease protein n=1 Tax=Rhizobium halophytocola TaxID=735519 RepID=A0ABS4DST5_9HYPH|nr:TRAP transporter small permease [Rhizobium halophytocola]MBP1848756.1 TRAP-type C4-dicarboxylate transport system permease small subunit [Rhizobium halophytocola]